MMIWRGKPQNDSNRKKDGKPKENFHRTKLPNANAGITALNAGQLRLHQHSNAYFKKRLQIECLGEVTTRQH